MSEQTITYVGEPLARQFKDKIEANKKNIANEVERATSKEAALEASITVETERATEAEGILDERIDEEMSRATAAEANLQSEINTIHTAQNCVDIVATYSELLELDTSILHDNDKVEVLADETHEGNVYVYRLSKQEGEEPEWIAIGSMISVGDSWKQWSKDNGSSAIDEETSAFLGVGNVSTEERSYQIGNGNTVTADSREPGDRKDTDISINIGSANTIDGEGFNLGKENRSTKFGITLGQRNESNAGSVTIGEKVSASDGSIAIGISGSDSSNLSVHARAGSTIIGALGNYDYEANGGSVIIAGMPSTGVESDYAVGGSMIFGSAFRATNGSMAIGAANTAEENTYIFGCGNNGYKGAFIIGRDNYSAGMDGIVFGRGNRVTNGIDGGNIIDGCAMAIGILNTGITGYSSAVGFNNHDVTEQSFVFGYDNVAHAHSVSLGFSNYTNNESFALGYRSHAEKAAITIGSNNTSYNGYGVLLGWNNAQPPAGPFATNGHGILLGSGNTHYGQSARQLIEASKYNELYVNEWYGNNPAILCSPSDAANAERTMDEYVAFVAEKYPEYQILAVTDGEYNAILNEMYYSVDNPSEICMYEGLYEFIRTAEEMTAFVVKCFPGHTLNILDVDDFYDDYYDGLIRYYIPVQYLDNVEVIPGLSYETMSLLAGTNNTSSGNNNLAIGINNFVGSNNPNDYSDPHNNGFATAIGYSCKAVRNYDFAMGYKSIAEGGENIAINQSTARGFNNLAMYNSNIYGIRNIGIHDSTLEGTLDQHLVVHNYLRNSKVTIDGGSHTTPFDDDSAFTYNTVTFANVNVMLPSDASQTTYCKNAWQHNTISGMSLDNTVALVKIGATNTVSSNRISGLGAGNNLRIGNGGLYADYRGSIDVPRVYSFDRNDVYMSRVAINYAETITDNIFSKAEIDVADANWFDRNVVTLGAIKQVFPEYQPSEGSLNNGILDNIVAMRSGLYIDRNARPSNDIFVARNVLLNGAILTADLGVGCHNSSVNDSSNSDNMLVNSIGQRLVGCFSFGTSNGSAADTYLYNCQSVYNFGDNVIRCSVDTVVNGRSNTILGALNSSITGENNKIYFEPDNPSYSVIPYSSQAGMNNSTFIFGAYNTIHPTPEQYRELGELHVSDEVTQQQLLEGIADGNYPVGTKLRASTEIRVNTDTTQDYFRTYDTYKYYNGAIHEENVAWDTPTITMDRTAFCQSVLSKTLIDNMYYKVSSTGYGSALPCFSVIEKDELLEVVAEGPCYCVIYGAYSAYDISQGNVIFGNTNDMSGFKLMDNFIVGYQNILSEPQTPTINADEATIHLGTLAIGTKVHATTSVRVNSTPIIRLVESMYYTYLTGCISETSTAPDGYLLQECTEDEFIDDFNAGVLQDTVAYYITESEGKRIFIPGYTIAPAGSTLLITDDPLHSCMYEDEYKYGIIGNTVFGEFNTVTSQVHRSQIFGNYNTVSCRLPYATNGSFIQGSFNTAMDGSNIVCIGGGNQSVGHNSVAIGTQLISNKWQTVIGKYNSAIVGPDRLAPPEQNEHAALFIVGNGYGDIDSGDAAYSVEGTWKDEAYIHRSNAMVVYADGTVEARRFVATDEPELALIAGEGLVKEDDFTSGTSTLSIDSELAKLLNVLKSRPKQRDKTYMLQSSGEDGTLSWVEVGMTEVE